jgi:type VI secretion system protein ImpF
MDKRDNEPALLPSIIDRLIDDEPGNSREPELNRPQSLHRLKSALKRDLEWLLNSRQHGLEEIPPGCDEVSRSLLTYGLPDFTSAVVSSSQNRREIRRALEVAITDFEPRLRGVKVRLLSESEQERSLHFRIEGRLELKPNPEPVSFDTVLQIHSGEYIVRGEE